MANVMPMKVRKSKHKFESNPSCILILQTTFALYETKKFTTWAIFCNQMEVVLITVYFMQSKEIRMVYFL
jgi:hypothetical protein